MCIWTSAHTCTRGEKHCNLELIRFKDLSGKWKQYSCVVGNFGGVQFSQVGTLQHFMGSIFMDRHKFNISIILSMLAYFTHGFLLLRLVNWLQKLQTLYLSKTSHYTEHNLLYLLHTSNNSLSNDNHEFIYVTVPAMTRATACPAYWDTFSANTYVIKTLL